MMGGGERAGVAKPQKISIYLWGRDFWVFGFWVLGFGFWVLGLGFFVKIDRFLNF